MPQPARTVREAQRVAGKTQWVQLHLHWHPSAGLALSPKHGHCRNGKDREAQHRDRAGHAGNKTHLGKMHAAVAEERQFGWMAFHVDEGAEQEGTWRWLLVSRARAMVWEIEKKAV